MTKNMGTMDRTVRLLVVAPIAALYYTDVVDGTLAIILGAVATVFLVTSAIGWCPTYTLLGVSTARATPVRSTRITARSLRGTSR